MGNRIILYLLLQLLSIAGSAQIVIKGRIADAEDGSPLSFCSVAIKGTSKGCLSNEDGYFTISADGSNDILIFYSLGYERKEIAASLAHNNTIKLEQTTQELSEVVVHAEDDRLYDLLIKCRKNIMRSKKITSKAYFQLTTKSNKQSVEMLECYYNATTKGSAIQELKLKNGRTALAELDNRYFVSFNTSKAISYLDLVKENEYLPAIPLQFSKGSMKKRYNLRQISEDEYSYHITFTSKKYPRSYFSGDLWINKKNAQIQKIQLNCEDAFIHPFIPFADDSLKKVSLYITHTYENTGNENRLNHVNFSYKLLHKSTRSIDTIARVHDLPEREIRTAGIIYFYDYDKPFLLPFYQYSQDYTDIRKISISPYNPGFWENATGLLHTEEQKKTLDFLQKHGNLINFNQHRFYDKSRTGFFETNNYTWTDSTRINYERNISFPGLTQSVTSIKIAAQIYLDVNEANGQPTHFSATVFDAMNSYAPEPIEPMTKCFMNIYFDLYEIERRKMEQKLSQRAYSSAEIKDIYNQTMKDVKQVIAEYTSEVNLGKNPGAMKQWNDDCKRQLGFDNMRIFEVDAQ